MSLKSFIQCSRIFLIQHCNRGRSQIILSFLVWMWYFNTKTVNDHVSIRSNTEDNTSTFTKEHSTPSSYGWLYNVTVKMNPSSAVHNFTAISLGDGENEICGPATCLGHRGSNVDSWYLPLNCNLNTIWPYRLRHQRFACNRTHEGLFWSIGGLNWTESHESTFYCVNSLHLII